MSTDFSSAPGGAASKTERDPCSGSRDRPPLIAPHGGLLVDRSLEASEVEEAVRRSVHMKRLPLGRRELADLLLIGEGALSPLSGFQTSREVGSVVEEGRLPSGLAWTIPITLQAKGLEPREGEEIALVDEEGRARALLVVSERFVLDGERVADRVYGTTDPAHPGVEVLRSETKDRIAGEIRVLPAPIERADARRLSPREVRSSIEARGWCDVAAFQTRNPLHRSHEYLLRIALEIVDGVLLHPLVGETKAGDVPADVRLACYEALVEHYLPKSRVLLSVLDSAMRYAGPAEAIHHAIMRQNYGASRLIVGRDHAGVGRYYGPFDAQARFDRYEPDALRIRPLKVDVTFWCKRCGGTASPRTCPHDVQDRLELSGTEVRRRLTNGEPLPAEFTRPEVAEILRAHYRREDSGQARA